ncbi:phenylalanine--tRNA ligase subunit beta [Sphingorhabdus pulchriflava]|uniref:Phenylalanine--tRNA ligase beta subunit n=1 Tax=Sphingorhabdus pulchriflava TaxID=2292257 RepID=A0A371B5H3_9SPHN|nr:phenylalanine--tRNA ligase subunit beta [Sphingorhabdus pulchriflava]RDV02804.1 phenylalanine--tRNA ligase subunit beta [Sphingorhabdus pulchriflava]
MKFSLSWLKYYLETDATIEQVADCLNRIGLEVEGIENPADKLAGFCVAKVLTAVPHPQADKLQVLTVDSGDGNPLQVVCGAPNARAGLVGVFGVEGATVPANGMVLKKTAIRGVESNGMMCSVAELELGDDHDGIIELPADAPIGMAFAEYADANDPVIDVAITPNRQDCMGVMGIARDLAAAGLGTFKPVEVPTIKGSYPCPTEIRTDDPEGCPAFYGRVIRGVKNGPSPDWMQARLKAAGQRPISALVDCTNYLMLACGRPAHAYDLAQLNGAVVARRAKDGEMVTALNGKEYTLTSEMTVIADESGVHDIAGIMGGEHSGCSDDTTDVLLEIAYFTPERIAKTGQALALTSDARSRFERGVDPAFLEDGLALLTDLIVQTCGGVPSEVIRAGQPPLERKTIAYDPARCAALGGINVPADRQRAILESLGFEVAADWAVTVPTWRRDVDGWADIVEEVVRIVGLDNVVSTPLPRADGVAKPTATPQQSLERKVRRAAAARGLNEAINWSFLPQKEADAFGGGIWSLDNPISEDMKVMRPSLLPGLLSAAQRNMDRGASSVRLFEIGRRYLADSERLTAGIVLAGEKTPRGWATGKAAKFDAYDAKAEALALLAAAGVATDGLMVMGEAEDHYHPGQSATLRMGPKNILAAFGTLHPATAKAFDLDGTVIAAEIFLDAIPAKKGTGFMRPAFTPPALQAVTRDFAFLVPDTLAAGDLVRAIRGCDKDNIVAVRLFDRFAGQGVPEGQVSLAIEVALQPSDKSYTDEELKAISDRVVAAASKQGAALRG